MLNMRRDDFPCLVLCLAAVTLICPMLVRAAGAQAAGAQAADDNYVLLDGSKVRLIRSNDQFAVFLRDNDPTKMSAAAKRLADEGTGLLRDFRGRAVSPIKVIDVEDTSDTARAAILADPEVAAIRPVYRFPGSDRPMLSTGTINVQLVAELPDDMRAALFADNGVVELKKVEGLHRVYIVEPIDGPDGELAAAERLADSPRARWAQPNLIRPAKKLQSAIRDEFFNDQWHLQIIDAVEAWAFSQGVGVTIGMFDDACDVNHPDLNDNYTGIGQDPTKDTAEQVNHDAPLPEIANDEHGTAMMGLAAAEANSIGVRGVAFLSQFTASRGVDLANDAQRASAFTFARQQDVDVHFNSWTIEGTQVPAIIRTAIEDSFLEGRTPAPTQDEPDPSPRGMVMVFAAGNNGEEELANSTPAALPWVIGVGASNQADQRATFSNYGQYITLLAPSGDSAANQATMTTTDNRETAVDPGYSTAENPDLDADGNYTNSAAFSGASTSPAAPVLAGVAALVLSQNVELTATDVRLILEHTADRIEPQVANYHAVTSRSTTHGYGRVNALNAVNEARESLTNGGKTWPERPSGVRIEDDELLWEQNVNTDEFLVLQSATPFEFVPQDDVCYSAGQVGCLNATIALLPSGVDRLFVGCQTGPEPCAVAETHSVSFNTLGITQYFAIFARSNIGRYSFGVQIDSDGNVLDPGPVLIPPVTNPQQPSNPQDRVSVTITATPLAGTSPLTVSFNGNALSNAMIDDSQTAWDFNTNDAVFVDSRSRNATYTYTVPEGLTQVFTARLTMVDINGHVGVAQINITVDGGGETGAPSGNSELRIIVGEPGSPGSDKPNGTSPFEVELSVEPDKLVGTLQNISWDLGDGTSASSITVPHVYVNTSEDVQRFPVSATITTLDRATTIRTTVSRLVAVLPGTGTINDNNSNSDCLIPGTCPTPGEGGGIACGACGTAGMIPGIFMLLGLFLMRRRLV